MEIPTSNPTTSEPVVNLELIAENNNGNLAENDFHFDYSTVQSSHSDSSHLMNVGKSNLHRNDFEETSNLVFYEKIPPLQEITASKVAIALWRRVISLEHTKRRTIQSPTFEFVRREDQHEVCKLIEGLPVPRLIRELVENRLSLVRSELNQWVRYFVQKVFKTKSSASRDPIEMSDLMFCHWLPNCTIDHRETALNMLSNPRLTVIDKFKIMCKYCFEDEIKKLPPKSIPENFIKKIKFKKNPLMYYWLCQMNGNLQELPRENDQSVECFLITKFRVDTWSAIEYFWNRLSFNEQVSKALVLIDQKPQFQKRLFSKMNEFQKYHVLSIMPSKILINFWKQKSQERFAYLTWIRIKDTITYDQFRKCIYVFLSTSLPDCVEKLRYLVKIWNSSSDDFINRALNSLRNIVIRLHSFYYVPHCNLEFLFTFLSCGSAEFRKAAVFEQGSSLVLNNDFSTIDRLIKLCLPDPKDVVDFKNILLNSENILRHCCTMLRGYDGDIEQLIKFVDHYCPNSSSKTEFLNRVLDMFTIDNSVIYYVKRWNILVEFIDHHILDTFPDQAIEFKKRIAWSLVDHVDECWSYSGESGKFIELFEPIIDAEDLDTFKTCIVDRLSARYRWSEFDEIDVHLLLSWCFNNDDQKMKQFKKSFPIEDVFCNKWAAIKWDTGFDVYGGDISWHAISHISGLLDKMLLWCLESVDEVKKYKLQKVFGYENSGCGYNMFIREGNTIDKKFTRVVLPWFFHGDEEQIRKFKEKYKNDVISRLIDIE